MKEYAKIGFNVTTFSSSTDNFSVYIKNCSEQVFTLYSNNITYNEFPIFIDVNLLLGDPLCYSYKIVENTTGFFCEGDNNTFTPTPTPTSTVTPTITPTQTVTPSITPTSTVTPTNTQTPTQTSTQTPTQTSTQTPTQTPTVTPTITPTSDPLPILSCSINFNENTSSASTLDSTFAVEDSPIVVNMFTLDSKSNSGKTTYSMNQTILNDIYDSKYRTFDLELPTFKGNKVLLKLQKRDNNSNNIKVTTFNRGISKTKTTKSDSVRYQVLDDSNNIIGGILFKNNRVEGFYEINSETTTLYRVENTTYNAIFDDDKSEFVCDNTLTGITEQLDVDYSVNTVNNNSYCVGVLWEVPWNLYNKIQTTSTYTVEEFIDIQDFWMNSIYSSTSNDVDISFYISGLIIYETLGDDPYDVENVTTGNIYNYINVVNNYRYQNYNYINYDLFLQLNHVRIPVYSNLNGIADGFGGMYGAPNSTNMSLVFGYEIYSVFDYQNSNTYYDIKVVSHEAAHNFGLVHTFSLGSFTFNGVSSLPIPGCTSNSCPSIQGCRTTLSYCRQWQNLTLDINTTRSLELANFLDTSGEHLICETPPLGSYLEIIIDDTNLTESQNTYTLELKDCNETQWYTYGTNLPYSSFTLNVYISDLPFTADCYNYKLTEELTNTVCDGNIFVVPSNITPTPTQTSTPTPTITTSITPTISLTPSITPTINTSPSIEILSPTNEFDYDSNINIVTLSVNIQNFVVGPMDMMNMNSTDGHFHYYINGVKISALYDPNQSIQLNNDLDDGINVVRVELVDHNHNPIGPDDSVTIYYTSSLQSIIVSNTTYGFDENNNTVANYDVRLTKVMTEDVNVHLTDFIHLTNNSSYKNDVLITITAGELTGNTHSNITINYDSLSKISTRDNLSWSYKGTRGGRLGNKYIMNIDDKYTYGDNLLTPPQISPTTTPTITPTISLTPTITPTITQTPSITPTKGTIPYNALSFYNICTEEYFTIITGGTLDVVGNMEHIEIGKISKHSYTELVPFKWWGCYQRVEYNPSYTQYEMNVGGWVWLDKSYDVGHFCVYDDEWPNSSCFEDNISLSGCCDGSTINVGVAYGAPPIGESAKLIDQIISTNGTNLVIGNCYTRVDFDPSYEQGPSSVIFNSPNFYSDPNDCITQNPCDVIDTEVEFVPFLSETTNVSIKESLITVEEVKNKNSRFKIDTNIVKDIKTKKYPSFEMNLPKTNSEQNTVTLILDEQNGRIQITNHGNTTTRKKEKPLLTTYKVKYNKKIIGSIGFSDDNIFGLYSFDGNNTVKLDSVEPGIIIAGDGNTETLDFQCGTSRELGGAFTVIDGKYDHEHEPPVVTPTGGVHYHNLSDLSNNVENVSNVDVTGETTNLFDTTQYLDPTKYYSIDLVYDIPHQTYLQIVNNGGIPQLFIEKQNLYLNAAYSENFNGDIKFNIKAAVIWYDFDPYGMESSSWLRTPGNYRDFVGKYYRDNHNDILPELDYNLVIQINYNDYPPQPGYNGIAGGINGIWYPYTDLDLQYANIAVVWKHNVLEPYNINPGPVSSGWDSGGNLNDIIILAHEVGHLLGMEHTWVDSDYLVNPDGTTNCVPTTGPNLTDKTFCTSDLTDTCYGCTFCCVSQPECYSVMSYCNNSNSELTGFRFSPGRIFDFYNNASVHGQHLLKNKIFESYYTIDLTETVFYEFNRKYTVEYKSCSDSTWTIYGTGFTYFDFTLKILESELPQYECFDFRVTVNNTQALSENRVYPYINPSNTPTPTATVTPFLTPTPTPLPSQTATSTPLPTPTPSVTPSVDFGDPNWPEPQPGQSKWFVPCNDSLLSEQYQGLNWQFFVSSGPTLSGVYKPNYYYSDVGTIVSVINYNGDYTFSTSPLSYRFTEFCFVCIENPYTGLPITGTHKSIYFTDSYYEDIYTATTCSDIVCLPPTPTPTPTQTPTQTITPTPSVTKGYVYPTPTPTPTSSVTPSITPTNTVTPSVTATNTPTISLTPSITPTNIFIDVKTIFVHYENL